MVRKVLYERLLKLGSKIKEPIKLDIEKELLEAILFDKQENGRKEIAPDFDKLINKIDLTGVSFADVNVRNDDIDASNTDFLGAQIGSKEVEFLIDNIILSSSATVEDVEHKTNVDTELVEAILFDNQEDGSKKLAFGFNEFIDKIDLTDISFSGVDVRNIDFTGSKGVKINPQTVKSKSLCGTKLCDTEIIGSFAGVDITSTDFTGSKGAKIDPQAVFMCSMEGTILNGVEIIGSFDYVDIYGTDFTGSKGAKIDPQTVPYGEMAGTKFKDAEIIGSFDECQISKVDFTGSKGAKVNPQTIWNKDLFYTTLCDTEIIGPFDDVDICGTDFTGSKGAKIDLQAIRNKDLAGTILCDAEITGSLDGIYIYDADFKGSNFKSLSITEILDILDTISDLENADSGQKSGFETSGVQKLKK